MSVKLQAPDGWELVEKPGCPKLLVTKTGSSGIGIFFNRNTQSLDIYGWYDSMVGIQGGQIALSDITRILGRGGAAGMQLADDAQPATATLDPALREPLQNVPGACDWDGTVVVTFDAYCELQAEANARIAELWRWIDGEPQRQNAAVVAKLREIANMQATKGRITVALEIDTSADELAPPPQQGGTEGREK